jgi:hypothetical protein
MSSLFAAAAATLVFCAPGYPGASGDAQPFMDQFAQAATSAAGWSAHSLTAIYDPTEAGGLAKLAAPEAALAFVPYPFFVQHAAELHLSALVQADVLDTGPTQKWTLVAKRGRLAGASSLSGLTILSTAGYAPMFVRGAALTAWKLPGDVRIESAGQILSALRRANTGEPVVVLLDQTQTNSLASLPFAGELQSVVQSSAVPVAVVAVVGTRLDAAKAGSMRSALLGLSHNPANADLLASLRLRGFVPADLPRIAAAP